MEYYAALKRKDILALARWLGWLECHRWQVRLLVRAHT